MKKTSSLEELITSLNNSMEDKYNDIASRLDNIVLYLDNITTGIESVNNSVVYAIEKIGVEELRDIILEEASHIVSNMTSIASDIKTNTTWEVRGLGEDIIAINTSHGEIIARIENIEDILNSINTTHQDIIDALVKLKEAIEEKCNTTIEWTPTTSPKAVGGLPVETIVYIVVTSVAIAIAVLLRLFRKKH